MTEGPIDLELAQRAVDAALAAGGTAAEAFAQESEGTEVRAHGGEVESLTTATERGIGVRAWIDGRVGYAYGTDLAEAGLAGTAEAAVRAARLTDPDQYAAAPAPAGEPEGIEGLHDPGLWQWSTERKVELALAVEAAAKAADPRVGGVEQAVYADGGERIAIASSEGVAATYEATSCFAYAHALASEGGGTRTGLGFGLGRSPEALDSDAIGAEAGRRAASLLGAKKPDSRSCPVILDPTVAASFAGTIASMVAADDVQRGRSPFADRIGEEIATPQLRLTDDGLDPEGLRSSPVDGEGVARRPVPVIEDGRLSTYLYDSYTARRAGTESTASAGRGSYRAPPSVSASNLVLEGGNGEAGSLLELAGEGVYVNEVAGLHSGVNPVSGTFSVGATGHRIGAGELAEPLAEFTIAGDLTTMLGSVSAIGKEARWVPFGGSVRTPEVLLGELTVSGA